MPLSFITTNGYSLNFLYKYRLNCAESDLSADSHNCVNTIRLTQTGKNRYRSALSQSRTISYLWNISVDRWRSRAQPVRPQSTVCQLTSVVSTVIHKPPSHTGQRPGRNQERRKIGDSHSQSLFVNLYRLWSFPLLLTMIIKDGVLSGCSS